METKIGVYICKGCDIGESLDIEKLCEIATDEMEAPVCKTHDVLCSREGIESIQADIDGEGVNRIVVAACSQRVFPEAFDFGGDVLTDNGIFICSGILVKNKAKVIQAMKNTGLEIMTTRTQDEWIAVAGRAS